MATSVILVILLYRVREMFFKMFFMFFISDIKHVLVFFLFSDRCDYNYALN